MKEFSTLVELLDWDFLTFLYNHNGKNIETVCNLPLLEVAKQHEIFCEVKEVLMRA